VYPALAVADALRREKPNMQLRFVGSADGMERELVERAGLSFAGVSAGPLHGVNVARMAASFARLARGCWQARGLVRRFRPDAVFVTGGWASVPVALAARLRGVPLVVFVPDIEPGLALRVAGRFARRVTATLEDTAHHFAPGKLVATGYPLRREVLEATRPAAIAHFELDPARQTLLVFGGSQGARSLNRALGAVLGELLRDGLQVLHITGRLDWPWASDMRTSLSQEERARYLAFPYLHEDMGLALAAADLAVSRAGAGVLGEFPYFGLPAVLVPYPHAWRYQKVNADWLAERGAAVCLEDADLAEELLPTVRGLLNAPDRLEEIGRRALALARPKGAQNVAQEVLGVMAT
jgi:undecaprenyldiphospho-muramoylpentapeptide beta-N-acetylglucosaminyltransferase